MAVLAVIVQQVVGLVLVVPPLVFFGVKVCTDFKRRHENLRPMHVQFRLLSFGACFFQTLYWLDPERTFRLMPGVISNISGAGTGATMLSICMLLEYYTEKALRQAMNAAPMGAMGVLFWFIGVGTFVTFMTVYTITDFSNQEWPLAFADLWSSVVCSLFLAVWVFSTLRLRSHVLQAQRRLAATDTRIAINASGENPHSMLQRFMRFSLLGWIALLVLVIVSAEEFQRLWGSTRTKQHGRPDEFEAWPVADLCAVMSVVCVGFNQFTERVAKRNAAAAGRDNTADGGTTLGTVEISGEAAQPLSPGGKAKQLNAKPSSKDKKCGKSPGRPGDARLVVIVSRSEEQPGDGAALTTARGGGTQSEGGSVDSPMGEPQPSRMAAVEPLSTVVSVAAAPAAVPVSVAVSSGSAVGPAFGAAAISAAAAAASAAPSSVASPKGHPGVHARRDSGALVRRDSGLLPGSSEAMPPPQSQSQPMSPKGEPGSNSGTPRSGGGVGGGSGPMGALSGQQQPQVAAAAAAAAGTGRKPTPPHVLRHLVRSQSRPKSESSQRYLMPPVSASTVAAAAHAEALAASQQQPAMSPFTVLDDDGQPAIPPAVLAARAATAAHGGRSATPPSLPGMVFA